MGAMLSWPRAVCMEAILDEGEMRGRGRAIIDRFKRSI